MGDYFRVIVPLECPFSVEEHGGNVGKASKIYASKHLGFCNELGISEADATAANFAQMMYLPRRAAEDAEYRHYLLAGRALSIDEMPEAKVRPARGNPGRAAGARERDAGRTNSSTTLSDKFEPRPWFNDYGAVFEPELFLDLIGWEVRNPHAGEGMEIKCPNHLNHSEPDDGDDRGCWICPGDGEKPFVITCRHHHCAELCTWDFVGLFEERVVDGEAALPDGYNTLSELLCDPMLYPDEVDGIPVSLHPSDYGADVVIEIPFLGSPLAVERAFRAVASDPHAGDRHFASLFGGVDLAGNKVEAAKKLAALIKEHGQYRGNDLTRLKKLGSEMADARRSERAREQEAEERKAFEEACAQELGNPSMDIAAPLGDTLPEALATLARRWGLVSVGGKFRCIKIPDLSRQDCESAVIEAMSKDDFINYHADRCISTESGEVNPAKVFFKYMARYSGITFAPPPITLPENAFNLYRGRQIQPLPGDCEILKNFIFHTICRDREDVFRFVWLYLAHLVQHPGEKPGSGIVIRGLGRCGKSTFGLIVELLSAPYCLTVAEQEHITGRFAGAHLATSLVAVCTEALFAGDPAVNGKLKSLITAPSMTVESKGLPVVQMPSYTRFIFDSNNERVVPIDGNGSELRYLVLEVNDDHRDDRTYFDPIYAAIEGDGIRALMAELAAYDPAADGLTWDDLRSAPDTVERRRMRWHSMRPIERALIQMLEDGEVTIRTEGGQAFRYVFEEGRSFRIPQAELRRHFQGIANKFDANDGDIEKVMTDLFGATIRTGDGREIRTVQKARGNVVCELHEAYGTGKPEKVTREAIRYFEFAPVDTLLAAAQEHYGRSPE